MDGRIVKGMKVGTDAEKAFNQPMIPAGTLAIAALLCFFLILAVI